MAERLEDFDWSRVQNLPDRYPWEEWFDGTTWKITRGVDFEAGSIESFRSQLKNKAYARGGKARTSIAGESIIFKFAPDKPTG